MIKQRIPSAAVYAITVLALAVWLEDVDGMEPGPITGFFGLIQMAIAGVILLAIACLVSLFAFRLGLVCGLAASVLSWPYFGRLLFAAPWDRLVGLMTGSPLWRDQFAAILTLIITTTYSLYRLRFLPQVPSRGRAT
jgi:hypothetical protein